MKPTDCRQRDCLNFFVRRERMTGPNEIFCLAGIEQPRGNCVRYTAPSWKPFHQSARLKKG